MAELKPLQAAFVQSAIHVIHGVAAVAELKLIFGYMTNARSPVIHGVAAVAELKPFRPVNSRQ